MNQSRDIRSAFPRRHHQQVLENAGPYIGPWGSAGGAALRGRVLLEGGPLIGALGREGFLRVVVVQDGGDRVAHSSFVTPGNTMSPFSHTPVFTPKWFNLENTF